MIDIVIPLKKNDYWGQEIRYALRSLEKNFKEKFEVHLIGHCPEWCKNVNHITLEENFSDPDKKTSNIGKALKVAMEKFSRFVWSYDDVYFIKPVSLNDINVPKVAHDLNTVKREESAIPLSNWQKQLWATYDRCVELGLTVYSAELHLCYYYESDKLERVFELFNVEEGEHLPHTAYFNLFFPGKVSWDLEKVGFYERKAFRKRHDFGKAKFLNHNDTGLSERLKKRIMEIFPDKSKFEK
jgi:hypothetical protein